MTMRKRVYRAGCCGLRTATEFECDGCGKRIQDYKAINAGWIPVPDGAAGLKHFCPKCKIGRTQ